VSFRPAAVQDSVAFRAGKGHPWGWLRILALIDRPGAPDHGSGRGGCPRRARILRTAGAV